MFEKKFKKKINRTPPRHTNIIDPVEYHMFYRIIMVLPALSYTYMWLPYITLFIIDIRDEILRESTLRRSTCAFNEGRHRIYRRFFFQFNILF